MGESVLRELANAGDAVYGFSEILVTSDVIGGTGVVRGHDVVRAFSCLDGFDGTEGAVAVGGEDDVGGLELLHVDLLDDDDIGLFDVRGHGVVADGVAAKAADGGVGHVVGEESDHAADGCEEQDQGQERCEDAAEDTSSGGTFALRGPCLLRRSRLAFDAFPVRVAHGGTDFGFCFRFIELQRLEADGVAGAGRVREFGVLDGLQGRSGDLVGEEFFFVFRSGGLQDDGELVLDVFEGLFQLVGLGDFAHVLVFDGQSDDLLFEGGDLFRVLRVQFLEPVDVLIEDAGDLDLLQLFREGDTVLVQFLVCVFEVGDLLFQGIDAAVKSILLDSVVRHE